MPKFTTANNSSNTIKQCVILAGGSSARMGMDKVFMPFKGKRVIDWTLDAAKQVFSEIVISAREPSRFSEFSYSIVSDDLQVPSPLAGIHAALKHFKTGRAVFLAVDMPLVSPKVLALLAQANSDADIIVPKIHGFYEPLLAAYSTSCIAPIEDYLKNGGRKVTGFYDYPSLKVKVIDKELFEQVDPALSSFTNLNQPEDLTAIEKTKA